MKTPAPPYANHLRSHSRSIWLYFGSPEAWGRASREHGLGWRNVLVLPLGEPPSAFDWGCVSGFSVLAVELEATSPELRHELVLALAIYGAREIYLVPHSRNAADAVMWNCGPGSMKAAA